MSKKTNKRPAKRDVFGGKTVPASVLVLDGEESSRNSVVTALRRKGYVVQAVGEGKQALEALTRMPIDLAVVHLQLSGMEGLDLLKHIKARYPETEVLVVANADNVDGALMSVDFGAYDYLITPFRPDELYLSAGRALEKKRLTKKIRLLEEVARRCKHLENIAGTSRAMKDIVRMVRQVARLDSTVLVSGENGTGKELIARTLHSLSPRKDSPLVVASCGAIPTDLQEVELFGRAGGGAPGTLYDRRGLFEEARGGTIFLDEVGELGSCAQAKMLHLLQNGQLMKIGTTVGLPLDVRVIAATNRNLEECVESGTFMEDLYYRLNVIPIHIPPLRERPEDIPLLAQRFVKRTADRIGVTPAPSISPRVMNLFMARPWPGNVRELECAIERAVALDRDGVIGMDDVPVGESQRSEDKVLDRARKRTLTLSELEREYILQVLAECGGSRKKTAESLGITTATLWRKLKQYEREG